LVCPENFFEMTTSTPTPRRQHFRENIFRCPFQSKSAPRCLSPQLLDASYVTVSVCSILIVSRIYPCPARSPSIKVKNQSQTGVSFYL
jgi:hypothetical protein